MVFLYIISFVIIVAIILTFSKIKIQIINLKFNSQTKRHINKDYAILVKLCILGNIPILKINITKTKLEKIKIQDKIKNIDFKYLEEHPSFDKEILKEIKKLDIQIKNINLHIDIGTENACLTSIIVPAISTAIAIILRNKIKKFENQIFIINPIYQNQNLINLYISGIFEIKMSHIISIIYNFNKQEKEGVKKYERASNRRPYDYSYE